MFKKKKDGKPSKGKKDKKGKGKGRKSARVMDEKPEEVSRVQYIRKEQVQYKVDTGKEKKKKKVKTHTSKMYEQNLKSSKNKVMLGVYLNVAIYIMLAICNLFLPLFNNGKSGYKQLFQWIILVANGTQLGSTLGLWKPKSNIAVIAITRVIQGLYSHFIRKDHMNWKIFAFLCVFDLIYLIIYMVDMSTVDYIDRDGGDI